jgi:hypothetical protein
MDFVSGSGNTYRSTIIKFPSHDIVHAFTDDGTVQADQYVGRIDVVADLLMLEANGCLCGGADAPVFVRVRAKLFEPPPQGSGMDFATSQMIEVRSWPNPEDHIPYTRLGIWIDGNDNVRGAIELSGREDAYTPKGTPADWDLAMIQRLRRLLDTRSFEDVVLGGRTISAEGA